VVVVRDDNLASGTTPFGDLVDPSDGVAGRLVVVGRTIPWRNFSQPAFGQERFVGSNITIAVDPWNSSRVYVAWADRVGMNDYTLHVRRSSDRGETWSNDLRTITNATNPALAVNAAGVVAFLYQQLTGTGATQRWETHLERTADDFATVDDRTLATVPADTPAQQFIPYLGDYIHVLALGDDFYGIFSTSNAPVSTNFPNRVRYQRNTSFSTGRLRSWDRLFGVDASIDPFFVSSTGQMGCAVTAWAKNRLDVFAVGTDQGLYHKWWDGSNWGPSMLGWEGLGGNCVGKPAVESWGANRLDLFVVGTDQAVHHKAWDGAAWRPSLTGWDSLGGIVQPDPMRRPAVVSWGANRLDVFVVGTDAQLYHKWWDGSAWGPSLTSWERLGGVCASPPAAVSWGVNRLDVFVVMSNGQLYHKWWDGSAWGPSLTGWERMGGNCVGTPAAVAWGKNHLDVFTIDRNRRLLTKRWDGTAWSPSLTSWKSLGGICTSSPAAVAWGRNRVDVLVRGTDKARLTDQAIFHKWWDGSTWRPSGKGLQYLGGVLRGGPEVASWASKRLDVFAVGTDRALYHKWLSGSVWGPSPTGWQSLGGVIDF
jgi:hypothetical protein